MVWHAGSTHGLDLIWFVGLDEREIEANDAEFEGAYRNNGQEEKNTADSDLSWRNTVFDC